MHLSESHTAKPGHQSWLLRSFALSALTVVMGATSLGASADTTSSAAGGRDANVVHAFKLYTGPDHASHVLEGTIDLNARTAVTAIHFKDTPAHSSYDWHNDPEPQYVITLSGTLKFTTRGGETFVVHPGDVLIAEDNTGSGHKWTLIDDQPWRRAYIVLKPGERDSFVPNDKPAK
jgi:quercetin dioxygenase-like cupin family protein